MKWYILYFYYVLGYVYCAGMSVGLHGNQKHVNEIFENVSTCSMCTLKLSGWRYVIWAATWENRIFAYAKTKTQISFAVTAKLISAFVFTTWIIQSLCFLNPKFHVCRYLLWLYSPVCVGLGRKPRRPVFWRRGSYVNAPLRTPIKSLTAPGKLVLVFTFLILVNVLMKTR